MTTVLDCLNKAGRAYNKHKGELGIEVETETLEPYKLPVCAFWDLKNDGSLRNFGIEYVLKQPLFFKKEIPEALKEFKQKTEGIPFIKDSITTSVHVHINMLNESVSTLVNFFTAYTLVENLLVRYAGESRRSNGFALPICDAEEVYMMMRNMVYALDERYFQGLVVGDDQAKYGGLNLAALGRFGSLEVRLFKGETDVDKIYNWLSILYRILEYARTKNMYPTDITATFQKSGVDILKTIFKEDYPLVTRSDQEQLINDNFLMAANVAHTISNWKNLENVKPAKKIAPGDIDLIANRLYGRGFNDLNAQHQREIMNLMQDQRRLEQILNEPVDPIPAAVVNRPGGRVGGGRLANPFGEPQRWVANAFPPEPEQEHEDDF